MRGSDDPSPGFWPAYADLALALVMVLVLFLLSQAIFSSRLLLTQDVSRLRVRQHQERVRAGLARAPGVDTIVENGNLQIITLSADFLFDTNDTRLTESGDRLLRRMSHSLRQGESSFTRIAVEAHADVRASRRFARSGDNPQDEGNWRLSAERAIRVVQLLQGTGIAGSRLEAVARSEYAPADTAYMRWMHREDAESVPAYRASLRRNRRLVIRLFYSEAGDAAPAAPRIQGTTR
jgi:outer membrane protein OmpA-like peptidoglycan-associated protein